MLAAAIVGGIAEGKVEDGQRVRERESASWNGSEERGRESEYWCADPPGDPIPDDAESICEAVTPTAVMNSDVANPETEQARTVAATSPRDKILDK